MRIRAAYDGPLGRMILTEEAGAIVRLEWSRAEIGDARSELLAEACRQLDHYFSGNRQAFDLPVFMPDNLVGHVMHAMCAIPFGETRTYGEIGKALSVPAQAIGQACGANPVPVIVPCHRVLGASGLGGFSAPGGVETKVALLRHEGAAGLLI